MSVQEVLRISADTAAASSVVGAILNILPPLAALFGLVWYTIVIYEKITGKQFKDSCVARFINRGYYGKQTH